MQDWCMEHSSSRIRCTLSPCQKSSFASVLSFFLLPCSIQLEKTFAQGWARMSCGLGRGRRGLRIHGVTTKSFMPFHCCWLNNNLRRGCLQSSACRRDIWFCLWRSWTWSMSVFTGAIVWATVMSTVILTICSVWTFHSDSVITASMVWVPISIFVTGATSAGAWSIEEGSCNPDETQGRLWKTVLIRSQGMKSLPKTLRSLRATEMFWTPYAIGYARSQLIMALGRRNHELRSERITKHAKPDGLVDRFEPKL